MPRCLKLPTQAGSGPRDWKSARWPGRRVQTRSGQAPVLKSSRTRSCSYLEPWSEPCTINQDSTRNGGGYEGRGESRGQGSFIGDDAHQGGRKSVAEQVDDENVHRQRGGAYARADGVHQRGIRGAGPNQDEKYRRKNGREHKRAHGVDGRDHQRHGDKHGDTGKSVIGTEVAFEQAIADPSTEESGDNPID